MTDITRLSTACRKSKRLKKEVDQSEYKREVTGQETMPFPKN